jgi:hypothetical protein
MYNLYTEVISKRVEKHRKVVRDFRAKENTPDNGGVAELVTALRTVWRALALEIWNYFINLQSTDVKMDPTNT